MTHKIHNFNCRPRQQRLYPSQAKPRHTDRQRRKAAVAEIEGESDGGSKLGIGSAVGIKVNTAKERTINKERCWQRRQAGRQGKAAHPSPHLTSLSPPLPLLPLLALQPHAHKSASFSLSSCCHIQ